MQYRYKTARQYIEACFANDCTPRQLAYRLDIDDAHLYRARKGDITPTTVAACQKLGVIPPPKTRVRIAADVTEEQRAKLHAIAAAEGLTWSEYCRRLADEQ